MQTYKHPFIYESIREAFEDFKERHGYNPAEMIADELGYRGEHKKQQLYNALNVYSQKLLKLDDFIIILNELLDSRAIPLRTLANHYGYSLVKRGEAPKESVINIIVKTNIEIEAWLGEFAKEVLEALNKGEIEYEEAIAIRHKIRYLREILDALDAKLMEMVEKL